MLLFVMTGTHTSSEVGHPAGAGVAGSRCRLLPVRARLDRASRDPGSGLLLALAAAVLPAAAQAGPADGATSSGQVEISVSVGSRYRLLAVEVPETAAGIRLASGQFCLSSNQAPPAMPVMLVRTSSSLPAATMADPRSGMPVAAAEMRAAILPCGSPVVDLAVPVMAPASRAGDLFLVRPE